MTCTFVLGIMSTTTLSADIGADCAAAVSAVNGKLEGSAGYIEDRDGDGARFHGVASLAVPIGCLFGAQVDLGGGDLDGDSFFGAGGHLFIRDPESYLVGVQGQYIDLEGGDLFRIGPEMELYLDQVTVSGAIGFEGMDELSTGDFLGGIEASYYITENLKIGAAYRHFLEVDAGAFTVEFQQEDKPVSVFADVMAGSDDFISVSGGIRFYFGGEDKSLIRRHREDDPPHSFNWLRKAATPRASCTDNPETPLFDECTGTDVAVSGSLD
ncbi:MAG: hypothetical protein ACKVP5_02045 [Aestuariivirga sp.]